MEVLHYKNDMKHLIIVGARGMGRECCNAFQTDRNYGVEFEIKGFLDDDPSIIRDKDNYPPIIGSVESYKITEDDVFFVALGDPKFRQIYAEKISEKGGEFYSCISDLAVVAPSSKIGKGVYIAPYAVVSPDVEIGDFTTIHCFCTVGHDVTIGKYTEIEANVSLGGSCKVSDRVIIHPHATISPKIKIENDVIVGAGSVVIRNVKDSTTVFGVPAKKIDF